MATQQFRVLYRQFLFRMVDLEGLSAHAAGDANQLLGRFAALLIFFSSLSSIAAFLSAGAAVAPRFGTALNLITGHFLIATTMLVVGLFAVLSWESTFPNRRDVFVLAPLPVPARTLFLAKVTAVASALILTVLLLHGPAGLLWPVSFARHSDGSILRWIAAFWITMIAAGAFIYCGVLAVQGLAAQLLPRRLFLRASSLFQMLALCLFVGTYFLQPAYPSADALSTSEAQRLLAWLPSYWFLGLLHQLAGSMQDPHSPLAALAHRAWISLAATVGGTAVAYTLSYVRTLRKIIEEPDLAPSTLGFKWLPPRFGCPAQTAIVQFCIRTLSRSRQHRMVLAFYLGLGFAFTIFVVKSPVMRPPTIEGAPSAWSQANTPLLAASIVMMALSVVGARVVFTLPSDLPSNWIFRLLTPSTKEAGTATRRALLVLSVMPVWLISAAFSLWLWPWRQAAGHLAILALLGILLTDLALNSFRKIPFTCSYLPGKSQVNMVFLGALGLMYLVLLGVKLEQQALMDPYILTPTLALLSLAAIALRWLSVVRERSDPDGLQFEESPPHSVQLLGLHRDGALPVNFDDHRSHLQNSASIVMGKTKEERSV